MVHDWTVLATELLINMRDQRENSIRYMERDKKLRHDHAALRRLQEEILGINNELERRKEE